MLTIQFFQRMHQWVYKIPKLGALPWGKASEQAVRSHLAHLQYSLTQVDIPDVIDDAFLQAQETLIRAKGTATCSNLCYLAVKYMKENLMPGCLPNVDIIGLFYYGHDILLINRAKNSSNHLPETWGDFALIYDPLLQLVYPAKEEFASLALKSGVPYYDVINYEKWNGPKTGPDCQVNAQTAIRRWGEQKFFKFDKDNQQSIITGKNVTRVANIKEIIKLAPAPALTGMQSFINNCTIL